MTFVSRTDWGATPTDRTPLPGPLAELYVHHTGAGAVPPTVAAEMAMMRNLQAYAIRPKAEGGKGYQDIPYNLVVGASGNIYEGRGIWSKSAATLDRNGVSRSVCAMGNYETATPTDALLAGIVEAGRMMLQQGALAPSVAVYGHRDNPAHPDATSCPGRTLYAHVAEIAAAITATPPQPPEDDMSTARLYRDRRYWNMWLIGVGSPMHLTPALKDSYDAAGVPTVVDEHDQLLESLLAQSGLTVDDLVPSG